MNVNCEWPIDRGCLPQPPEDPEARAAHNVRLQAAVDTAVQVLWAFTGRQFGCQTLVARPRPGWDDPVWDDYMPVQHNGRWTSAPCSTRPDGPTQIVLPGPVASVLSVEVEGATIDPSSYRLEGDRLYRIGGLDWPAQDLTRPLGEPGTWSVTYRRGVEPPAGAGTVVGQLALEFWNVCEPGKPCRLPKRWQTVTRQGVSVTKADPTDILASGRTGLAEIDTWVAAHNPHGLDRPATVMSADSRGPLWR